MLNLLEREKEKENNKRKREKRKEIKPFKTLLHPNLANSPQSKRNALRKA